MVFVLSDWSSSVAANFLRRQLQGLGHPMVDEDLVEHIETACLNKPDDWFASLFQSLDSAGLSAAQRAVKHYVRHCLYLYTVDQNCKRGVAPSREQLAAEGLKALESLSKDVPAHVIDRFRSIFTGNARSLRRWLASWRKRWGGRIGKLLVTEQLATPLVQKKAGSSLEGL